MNIPKPNSGRRKRSSFAVRFARLVKEFGSRYRLAKVSGVSESTLQQYAQKSADLPPRADILMALAHAANVSIEWLATGKGEMRPAGILPGAAFADVVMVELRDIHASLHMQQIRAFLPFSRWWLEHRLGISEPKDLILIEADQDLPPEIRERDLLLVDRSAGNKLPRGEGLYVFSVPTGLAVKRVEVGLKRGFVVTGPGMSEELEPMEIDRLVVGQVIWRCGKI
ncbi:MAG: helix-turn-helix domain-containing protein [Candidatus Binataceae bacterium]